MITLTTQTGVYNYHNFHNYHNPQNAPKVQPAFGAVRIQVKEKDLKTLELFVKGMTRRYKRYGFKSFYTCKDGIVPAKVKVKEKIKKIVGKDHKEKQIEIEEEKIHNGYEAVINVKSYTNFFKYRKLTKEKALAIKAKDVDGFIVKDETSYYQARAAADMIVRSINTMNGIHIHRAKWRDAYRVIDEAVKEAGVVKKKEAASGASEAKK